MDRLQKEKREKLFDDRKDELNRLILLYLQLSAFEEDALEAARAAPPGVGRPFSDFNTEASLLLLVPEMYERFKEFREVYRDRGFIALRQNDNFRDVEEFIREQYTTPVSYTELNSTWKTLRSRGRYDYIQQAKKVARGLLDFVLSELENDYVQKIRLSASKHLNSAAKAQTEADVRSFELAYRDDPVIAILTQEAESKENERFFRKMLPRDSLAPSDRGVVFPAAPRPEPDNVNSALANRARAVERAARLRAAPEAAGLRAALEAEGAGLDVARTTPLFGTGRPIGSTAALRRALRVTRAVAAPTGDLAETNRRLAETRRQLQETQARARQLEETAQGLALQRAEAQRSNGGGAAGGAQGPEGFAQGVSNVVRETLNTVGNTLGLTRVPSNRGQAPLEGGKKHKKRHSKTKARSKSKARRSKHRSTKRKM